MEGGATEGVDLESPEGARGRAVLAAVALGVLSVLVVLAEDAVEEGRSSRNPPERRSSRNPPERVSPYRSESPYLSENPPERAEPPAPPARL